MTLIRRHPILSAVAVVLLLVAAVIGASAFTVWRAAHTDDASRVDRADIIIVLGAAQYGGTPSPVFAGRLDHALLLYRQGRAGGDGVLEELQTDVARRQPLRGDAGSDDHRDEQRGADELCGGLSSENATTSKPERHG